MEDANRDHLHQMTPARIRLRASLFHLGNLVCMLAATGAGVAYFMDLGLVSMVLSVALLLPTIFWFGASIALYSFFAQDPHTLVSRHTGYFFYGASGAGLMVIAFLQKVPFTYLIPVPGLVVALVIGLAIKDLVAILRTDLEAEAIQ
ncbi:MAG: hypothetical protein ABEJ96_08195 [Thiohalorhabdaceae bacterium]